MSTSVVPFQAGEEASASKLNQDLEAVRALGQTVMDSITGEQTTKLLDLERALNSLNGRRQRAGHSVEPTALAVFAVTDLLSTDQNQTTATVRIDTGAVTLRERPQVVNAQIKSTQFSSSTGTVTPLDNDNQMYQVYCPDGSTPAGVFLLELMSPLDLTLLVIDISAMMSQPTITLEVSADGLVWVPAQVEQNGYSLTGVIPPTVVRYVRLSMTPAQSDNIGSQTFTFGLTDFSASAVEFQLVSEWVSLPVPFSPLGQNVQLVTDNDPRLSFYLALAADNSQPFAAVTPSVPLAIPGIANQTFSQVAIDTTGKLAVTIPASVVVNSVKVTDSTGQNVPVIVGLQPSDPFLSKLNSPVIASVGNALYYLPYSAADANMTFTVSLLTGPATMNACLKVVFSTTDRTTTPSFHGAILEEV